MFQPNSKMSTDLRPMRHAQPLLRTREKLSKFDSSYSTVLSEGSCAQCVSGQRECQVAQCDLNGVCQGNLLGHTVQPNGKACQDECKKQETCLWYSYGKTSRICFVFETCPNVDESQLDFVTGQPFCETDYSTCKTLDLWLRQISHKGRIGDALETLWGIGRIGDALGTLWGRIGDTMGTLWGRIGDAMGTL